MTGFVLAERDRFKHKLFRNDEFCAGYAWDWLVAQAAYSDVEIWVKGKSITLHRGQLCFSTRFLAEAWKWSKSKTHRFLTRLKTEAMIETRSETGQLIITICNYDYYQSSERRSGTEDGTGGGTAAGQQRDSSGTKNNKKNTKQKNNNACGEEDDLFSAQSEPLPKEPMPDPIEEGFERLWASWPSHNRKFGKADCRKVYRQACTGTHPKADGVISPADLNFAALAYTASVTETQFLKGILSWLRQAGWEPFVGAGVSTFRPYEELNQNARNLLEDGKVPPSLQLPDGKPNAEAAFHLRRFGYEVSP